MIFDIKKDVINRKTDIKVDTSGSRVAKYSDIKVSKNKIFKRSKVKK